jgi:hypothetical protein
MSPGRHAVFLGGGLSDLAPIRQKQWLKGTYPMTTRPDPRTMCHPWYVECSMSLLMAADAGHCVRCCDSRWTVAGARAYHRMEL